MPFLSPNQRSQSAEGNYCCLSACTIILKAGYEQYTLQAVLDGRDSSSSTRAEGQSQLELNQFSAYAVVGI